MPIIRDNIPFQVSFYRQKPFKQCPRKHTTQSQEWIAFTSGPIPSFDSGNHLWCTDRLLTFCLILSPPSAQNERPKWVGSQRSRVPMRWWCRKILSSNIKSTAEKILASQFRHRLLEVVYQLTSFVGRRRRRVQGLLWALTPPFFRYGGDDGDGSDADHLVLE